ncbi:hypothetical protein PAHAL_9G257000 [Panicum hallii]|uniref:Uncharacterized protein n=1 Tax=Panicum hallii TaxID=206008 RepID=A0A2T8I2K3_9POAL|nr:hypothetical protein PAHAL_9G257000 [Panicum hallii]
MTQIPFHLLLPETFLTLAPDARAYRTAATDPARPTSASDPSRRAPPEPQICPAGVRARAAGIRARPPPGPLARPFSGPWQAPAAARHRWSPVRLPARPWSRLLRCWEVAPALCLAGCLLQRRCYFKVSPKTCGS